MLRQTIYKIDRYIYLFQEGYIELLARDLINKYFSRFSSNSEASALELLENREEIFIRYYMHSDDID